MSEKKRIEVDVILPFYRPKGLWCERVLESLEILKRYFSEKNCALRLIITNDGSDLSFFPEEKLNLFRESVPMFEFMTYKKNHGKGYCLRHAVQHAPGDFQIYTDGDFPFYPEGVIDAYELLAGGADVVMGVRSREYKKALSPFRKILSANVRRMNRVLLQLPTRNLDTQAGLKGFNRHGRAVFLATKVNTFLFDTEFIALSRKNKLKIAAIPLKLRPGLSFSKMGSKVMLRELVHFFRILFRLHFTSCGKIVQKGDSSPLK